MRRTCLSDQISVDIQLKILMILNCLELFNFFFMDILYLECDPGYFWHHTELQCEICPTWEYSPTGDTCIRCPDGQRTSHEGSTSPEDCHPGNKVLIQLLSIISKFFFKSMLTHIEYKTHGNNCGNGLH